MGGDPGRALDEVREQKEFQGVQNASLRRLLRSPERVLG